MALQNAEEVFRAAGSAASKVVQDYGVATECGLGRRPSETIMDLLRIHQQAAEL